MNRGQTAKRAPQPAPRREGLNEALLLPYQRRLIECVGKNPVTVYEKSRRIGLSWTAAAIAALTAGSSAAAGGMNVYYMGYNLEMTRNFIEDCGRWARGLSFTAGRIQERLLRDPEGDVKSFRIAFASGFSCAALPARARALRGKQGMIILDEAAFCEDLDALLKAAVALLIWGGKLLILSTHHGAGNPFNRLVESIRAGQKPYALLRTSFDEALAEGLYRRICLVEGRSFSPKAEAAWRDEIYAFYGEGAAEELDLIPTCAGGAYFSSALIEARMGPAPVLRYACPPGHEECSDGQRTAEAEEWCQTTLAPLLSRLPATLPHVFGLDFGRSGDLSVFWPLTLETGLHRETPFVVELRNVPFRQQEQILFFLADRLPRLAAGALDARGNGSFLAEFALQRYGAARIHRVMLTSAWYLENFPRYKAALEDGRLRLPRDRDILDDHRAVVIERGIPRLSETRRAETSAPAAARPSAQGPANAKLRHGDSAIAAVLAYFASRQGGSSLEFEKIAARTDWRSADGHPRDGGRSLFGGVWNR